MYTEKMAVVSTAHISHADIKRLENDIRTGDTNGLIRDEGLIIYTGLPNELDKYPTLKPVVDMAIADNVLWIMLDMDGEVYDNLPQYDW